MSVYAKSADFQGFGFGSKIMSALKCVGYEIPTPVQARAIPVLKKGQDLICQSQTGTGKTAAFALPLLERLEMAQRYPQVLVLTPTRELAIQVSAAFTKYGQGQANLLVLPIYGGQSYSIQSTGLRKGPQVVVGTPGRVIDSLERGVLKLDKISTLVLDEADEMLNMGFLEDVERIIKITPENRQLALFSATMPAPIKRIAEKYLKKPVELKITGETSAAETVNQRYWLVQNLNRLDALARILEAEERDGVIVFVRTKMQTVELSDSLVQRGFSAQAINGDMEQRQREHTIEQFRMGKLDILVATDVAARGLDVNRVSHVINYEVPFDVEGYVHRIGRTGRAGRSGEAILFVAPHERYLLRAIERGARVNIRQMALPSLESVSRKRLNALESRLTSLIEGSAQLHEYQSYIKALAKEKSLDYSLIAAALLKLSEGSIPLFLKEKPLAEVIPLSPKRPKRQRVEDEEFIKQGDSKKRHLRERSAKKRRLPKAERKKSRSSRSH